MKSNSLLSHYVCLREPWVNSYRASDTNIYQQVLQYGCQNSQHCRQGGEPVVIAALIVKSYQSWSDCDLPTFLNSISGYENFFKLKRLQEALDFLYCSLQGRHIFSVTPNEVSPPEMNPKVWPT